MDQRSWTTVERLEARIAPAAVATFSKGTLLITGDPGDDLRIEQKPTPDSAEFQVEVRENGELLAGTSAFEGVKNIVVKLDKAATGENTIDFSLFRLTGGVVVHSPKDASTLVTFAGQGADSTEPHIGKGLLLKGGAGLDTLSAGNITIGKGLVFKGGGASDSFSAGAGFATNGNVALLGVPSVFVNAGATIDGDLLITQKEDLQEFYGLGSGSVVTGNVSIYAGPGSTTINAYAQVAGQFVAHAGSGPSSFNVSLTAKSLQYVGGGSNDSVALLRSDIAGSATFVLSGGSNQMFFDVGPASLLGDFVVGKNLKVGGGSGTDTYGLHSSSNNVRVAGTAAFSLSGGDNILRWDGELSGKSINISTAGGDDVVNIFGLNAPQAALSVDLGAADDRLAISSNFLRASLDGGSGTDDVVPGSQLPADRTVRGFEAGV